MPKQPRPRLDQAARVVAELFDHPPVSEAELDQRFAGVDPGRARYRLLQRLRSGLLYEGQVPLLVHAFSCLGVGEEGEALVEIARDGEDPHRGAAALQILASTDPAGLEALVRQLDPVQAMPVVEHWLSDLLGAAHTTDGGQGVARALESMPPASRGAILEVLEDCRVRVGTSAAAAYGVALARPALASLHESMLEALVSEASSAGIALLERFWRATPVGSARHLLESALLRARTRQLNPRPSIPDPGLGYLGSCDGQGTFVVVGATENREDGSFNVAQVCVRAGGELCDGFLTPRCSREELRERLSEITHCSGIEFVSIDLAEASSISRAAYARTCERGELSEGARAALSLLERAGGAADPPLGEGGDGIAVEASLEPLRALLSRPPYQHSWFFDRGDLDGNGVSLPGEGDHLDDWVAAAALSLDRPSIRDRLAAMARHMARWHRRGAEPRAAALCESAAREVERACGESALLRAMLEQSIVPEVEEASAADAGRDPVLLRQLLKRFFFAQVSEPRGRDLARLDFTEAAFGYLEEACLSIPSERRPREEHRARAAYAVGKAFADFLLAGAQARIEQVIDQIERALHEICHLDRAECRGAIERVLPLLGAYIDSHCARCPVACLDRPEAALAEAFFAPEHPVPREVSEVQKGR